MDDEEEGVHKLEGSSSTAQGGLIIKKKPGSTTPRLPQVSKFGLDRLAAEKRKEESEVQRLRSFGNEEEGDDPEGASDFKKPAPLKRHYRETQLETPTYTGGVSSKARDRLKEHEEKKREKRRQESSSKDRNRHRDHRHRDRRDRSDRSDRRSERSSREGSVRSVATPYRDDEPRRGGGGIGLSSWDDEEDDRRSKSRRSEWDAPTPRRYSEGRGNSEWSERSHRPR